MGDDISQSHDERSEFYGIKGVMEFDDKETLIRWFRKLDVVKREDVVLKHAGDSKVYIDIKKVYGYPDALSVLCRMMKDSIDKKASCIAAGGYGGLSLAGAMAVKYKFRVAMVREKPKTHGRNVWIDGYMPKKGDRVWILITSSTLRV